MSVALWVLAVGHCRAGLELLIQVDIPTPQEARAILGCRLYLRRCSWRPEWGYNGTSLSGK